MDNLENINTSIDDFDYIFKYEICKFLDIHSFVIVYSTYDGYLIVSNLINKETKILKLCDVDDQDSSVYSISLLKDNDSLYFITLKHIKICSLKDGKVSYFKEDAYRIRINCISTSHDSKMICSSGIDYVNEFIIKLWDIETKSLIYQYAVNKIILCYPYSINFSYSNDLVIFGQDHETEIKVLDIKEKHIYSIQTSHDDCIINALFTKDDKLIISASLDGVIIVRDNMSPVENKIVNHDIDNDRSFDRLEDIYIDKNDEFLYSLSLKKCMIWDITNNMLLIKVIKLPEYVDIHSSYSIIMYDKILCVPSVNDDIILINTEDNTIQTFNTNLNVSHALIASSYEYTKNDMDIVMNVLMCLNERT